MIPILYEKTETEFDSNGLGRLRDVTSCIVTEERNGVYECNFEYPVDGAHFEDIQLGRIIAVEHDETNDVQPFDIVSYSRPIDGVVSFHAVHISYRQSKITTSGSNINSLADAFAMLANSNPENPFSYWTDKASSGYMAAADGTPYSVKQLLGGMEGSILDAYGGEYEWNRFIVRLWNNRGQERSLTIRYGVNMIDYTEETDYSESCNAVVPYWKGTDSNGNNIVVAGNMVVSSNSSYSERTECLPIDFTDKFEAQPTKAQLESLAATYIAGHQTYLPAQTINVDFVRLADSAEYQRFAKLQECKLCDTIRVVFPSYKQTGYFKIVKTEYDVLLERYTKMELGTLSTTLAEALGVGGSSPSGAGGGGGGGFDIDFVYPVGSYYETSDTAFDPNIAWGGTWVLETAGQVHVSAGTGYAVSGALTNTTDGGASTVTLNATQIPAHTHGSESLTGYFSTRAYGTSGTGSDILVGGAGTVVGGIATHSSYTWSGSHSVINAGSRTVSGQTTSKITINATHEHNSVGGGQAHNNMQPYIIVNRWHRTA